MKELQQIYTINTGLISFITSFIGLLKILTQQRHSFFQYYNLNAGNIYVKLQCDIDYSDIFHELC